MNGVPHEPGVPPGRTNPRPRRRSGPFRGLVLLAGTTFALAACSSPAADPVPASVPARASAPASSAPPSPDVRPVTIAFGGDVHFADQVARLLDRPGGLAALEPSLGAADLSMVNLETAITSRGSEQPKQFHFRTTPKALTALQEAGVDVVTMANNHAVDYGPDGLADTLQARRDSPIPIVGVGADAGDAYRPAYLTVRGHTIAVLGATQVPDWTLATWPAGANRPGVASASATGIARLTKAVAAARKRAELVVVYLHWGTDYQSCPNALQKQTAKALEKAGAGLIVGAHAHKLQGSGWLDDAYVDYGLGNFVWWRRNNAEQATTGVLTVAFDPKAGRVSRATWQPMMVSDSGLPETTTGDDASRQRRAWTGLRSCTGLAAEP